MHLSAFDQLNVSSFASDDEIKNAYLALVRDNPPDRNPARFEEIRKAYELIATEEQRLNYLLFHPSPIGLYDIITTLMQPCPSAAPINSQLLCSLLKDGLDVK